MKQKRTKSLLEELILEDKTPFISLDNGDKNIMRIEKDGSVYVNNKKIKIEKDLAFAFGTVIAEASGFNKEGYIYHIINNNTEIYNIIKEYNIRNIDDIDRYIKLDKNISKKLLMRILENFI
jgi:hypothetical protein